MNKFRKLKEYDDLGRNGVTILNLMDRDCEFWYDGKTYRPTGTYCGSHDFLLEYYVKGIKPMYRIENDKIVPYLHVTLNKEEE